MPNPKPKPSWMQTPRVCPWKKCHKSFIPKKPNQIYCCRSHSVRASQTKSREKGDIRIVKACPFTLLSGIVEVPDRRCSLEAGHRGDHLIRVENEADFVLDSKTEGVVNG